MLLVPEGRGARSVLAVARTTISQWGGLFFDGGVCRGELPLTGCLACEYRIRVVNTVLAWVNTLDWGAIHESYTGIHWNETHRLINLTAAVSEELWKSAETLPPTAPWFSIPAYPKVSAMIAWSSGH